MAFTGKKVLRLNLDRAQWGMTVRRVDGTPDPKFDCPPGGFTLDYLKRHFIPSPESLRWEEGQRQVGLRAEHEARSGDYIVSVVFPSGSMFHSAEGVIGDLNAKLERGTAEVHEVDADTYPKRDIVRVLQEAARLLRDSSPESRVAFGDPRGFFNIPAVVKQFMTPHGVARHFVGVDRGQTDVAEVFEALPADEKRALLDEAMNIFVVGGRQPL